MSSYDDLVNIEIGKASNYGSHFKVNRLCAIEAIKKSLLKRKKNRLIMRVYIAGGMDSGNTHKGHFAAG